MDNRKFNLALAAIFETGIILRFWELGMNQLWYDEAFTLILARLDIPRLIQATAWDVHPPLHYLIEWVMIRLLGPTPFAMRLPSALFSIGALFLAWQIAERLKLSRPAILAGLGFLALNPVQLWFAQDARMYCMLQFLVLLSLLAVLERRWVVLGISSALALWLHNYGLVYLPVIGLLAIWLNRHELETQLPKIGLALILPFLSWLPWAFVLLAQMGIVSEGYWIAPLTPGVVIYDLAGIFWGIVIKTPFDTISILVFVGMAGICLARAIQRREHGLLLWIGLAPMALAILISVTWKPILLFRALIGSVPPLVLMMAEVLAGERQTWLNRAVAAAVLLPVILYGQFSFWIDHQTAKGMDRVIVDELIRPNWQEGDIIMNLNDGTAVMVNGLSPDLPQYELASNCHPPVGALSDQTRSIIGIRQMSIDRSLEFAHRIWFIGAVGSTSYKCEQDLLDTITHNLKVVYYKETQFVKSGVWIYAIPAAARVPVNRP